MPTATREGTPKPTRVMNKAAWFERTGYVPHEGQAAVHYDPHRHRVLCNGRRWGKTLLGGKEIEPRAFVRNRMGEAQVGWIVGPQFTDCEKEFRVVYDTFKKLDVNLVSSKFLNNVDNGNMHIKTNWGFELQCRSAMHPETLTGEGLDFVLMVEAGKHRRKTWTEYVRPSLSDKRGWSLHTGVPEGASQTSLLYFLWQRGLSAVSRRTGRQNPWKSWRMPSWTNTTTFPGGREDPEILDAEEDLTEDEFARQYEAKFVERVGRVMQEWDDEVHLADLKYVRGWPLYLAIDYGYTNPFVILFIQVDAFNNVYVLRERRYTMETTQEVARKTLEDPLLGLLVRAAVAIYPDPAEPDDTETLKKEWRKPARTNTGGELRTRLNLIRQALKTKPAHLPPEHPDRRPGLLVDRSCTVLAWEMREGYRWPEHKAQTINAKNETENPLDKDNHGVEALGRFFKGYMEIVGGGRHAKQHQAKIRSQAKGTDMGTRLERQVGLSRSQRERVGVGG